ncbi:Uncharacterized protein APZ42_031387 [Daphnia magna]|uniref:Uncharacterized protein n=1 Tax=Daphnia magna TaxID=35525 RepID=A0A164MWF0_9CRUS|nr:Uncharacterized protein APZ42_031387 [Daphnia magna]
MSKRVLTPRLKPSTVHKLQVQTATRHKTVLQLELFVLDTRTFGPDSRTSGADTRTAVLERL